MSADDDGPITIDLNAPEQPEQKQNGQQVRPGGPPYVDRVPLDPAPDTLPPPPADEGPDLEQQLRDLQKRERAANDRAKLAENQRLAEQQRSQVQVAHTAQEKEQSDYYSVVNALAAKNGELAAAKTDYMNAIASGDHAQATDINDRMMDLKQDIRDLSQGKQDFESKFEQRKRQPPLQQVRQPANIEEALATMPDLLDSERNWARRHPDVLSPQQFQRLTVAYGDAQRQGIERGSEEYFKFLNGRLDYTEDGDMSYDQPVTQQQQPPQRRAGPPAAAPVSRTAPGAMSRQTVGHSESQVTLSPQQREAARFSKIDEKTYAQNVRRLNDLKRKGYYQEVG